ncbi:2-amino-4-hydroxy-6-hydroxymethyldihydropteridine diphosphokinase [candidate division KSB1 bacterium]|nr:2-amino-4-hydroxy-6-hydroxymethyldihydropteridine diphosphokinase [candidate division KSB1 bacterium]
MNKVRVFLSLGSNLGERIDYLTQAVFKLKRVENIQLVQTSAVYETEPVGYKAQNHFLNIVVELNTTFTVRQLFRATQNIENSLGRQRFEKWGPRTIDIDILFYNAQVISSTDLTVPHPEFKNRMFVLKPLSEIAAEYVPPLHSDTIYVLYKKCNDKSAVNPFMNSKTFLQLVK